MRLQAVEEIDAERRLGDGQGIALRNHLTHQILLYNLVLLEHLDGQLPRRIVPPVAEKDLAESAPADRFENVKVLDARGETQRGHTLRVLKDLRAEGTQAACRIVVVSRHNHWPRGVHGSCRRL